MHRNSMWIKIQQMQQYADVYLLQSYSTCFGCHSHKPVPIRPRWEEVAVQVVWPVPEAAGTVFNTPDDGCCDTWNT